MNLMTHRGGYYYKATSTWPAMLSDGCTRMLRDSSDVQEQALSHADWGKEDITTSFERSSQAKYTGLFLLSVLYIKNETEL